MRRRFSSWLSAESGLVTLCFWQLFTRDEANALAIALPGLDTRDDIARRVLTNQARVRSDPTLCNIPMCAEYVWRPFMRPVDEWRRGVDSAPGLPEATANKDLSAVDLATSDGVLLFYADRQWADPVAFHWSETAALRDAYLSGSPFGGPWTERAKVHVESATLYFPARLPITRREDLWEGPMLRAFGVPPQ